MYNQTNT